MRKVFWDTRLSAPLAKDPIDGASIKFEKVSFQERESGQNPAKLGDYVWGQGYRAA